jgi:DNA-binding Lrp family transcriptional regulator
MNLQPRHYKLIKLLEENPKRYYGVDELAKTLSLSLSVLRNELPNLVQAGYLRRRAVGRTFEYYAPKAVATPVTGRSIEPITALDYGSLLKAVATPSYEPKLNRLGWNLPKVLAELGLMATSGDLANQYPCRKALVELLEATEAYAATLRHLLATPQLWDEQLSTWLTASLSEKNLEKLEELTRQAIEAHGRLEPSKTETETT